MFFSTRAVDVPEQIMSTIPSTTEDEIDVEE